MREKDDVRTIVIGLGNPILGDDGVGWRIADLLATQLADDRVDVECLAVGGLDLMERLEGYRTAVIIDAMVTGSAAPGDIAVMDLESLPDLSAGHTTSAHDTSLATAMRLGRAMGIDLPDRVWIVAVESESTQDFAESLTPAVAASVPAAARTVRELLEQALTRR